MMRHLRKITTTIVLLLIVSFALHAFIAPVFAQDDATPEPEMAEEGVTEESADAAAAEEVSEEEAAENVAALISNLDTVWMLVAAFLVFWMQAGFALVEAGFVRAKNVTNILMKRNRGVVFNNAVNYLIGENWS